MKKSFFISIFFLIPLFLVAQKKDCEKSIVGHWELYKEHLSFRSESKPNIENIVWRFKKDQTLTYNNGSVNWRVNADCTKLFVFDEGRTISFYIKN